MLTRKGWGGTTMRFQCAARILYDDAVADPEKIHNAIGRATEKQPQRLNPSLQVVGKPIERRVFHAVDRHDETDAKTLERKKIAQDSWNPLYESGALIPAHYWDNQYARNAKDEIGDRRKLPYFKDLLKHTMEQMDDDDILLWSNDDNIIHPKLPEYLKFHLSVYGPCSIMRTELMGRIPSLELSPEQFDRGSRFHIGRDGFAFTKQWLVENWDKIPDFILAASDFDLVLACLIRLEYGIKTTGKNMGEQIFPAEIPRGYTGHVWHHSTWDTRDVDAVLSNIHNRKLFRVMRDKYLPDLKLKEQNTLA